MLETYISIARHAGTNANDKDIAGEQLEFSLAMLQPLTNVCLKLGDCSRSGCVLKELLHSWKFNSCP